MVESPSFVLAHVNLPIALRVHRGGIGLANVVASIGTLGCTDANAIVD
jgi:hypothetical protein